MDVFKTVKRVETAVEMAIALKQHLRDRYSRARESSVDPASRDLFSFLAAEQERLLGLYRQFLDEMGYGFQQVEHVGEYGKYIAMLISHIPSAQKAFESMSIAEALENALQIGDETCEAFTVMDATLNDARVKRVCTEEKRHRDKIGAYREALEKR